MGSVFMSSVEQTQIVGATLASLGHLTANWVKQAYINALCGEIVLRLFLPLCFYCKNEKVGFLS
jgi:hypothetical protein